MGDKTIQLRSGRLGRIMPGHPWIFKNQVRKTDAAIKPGELVSIVDSGNKFIGVGYYNPRSEISVRILSFEKAGIDKEFFHHRIEAAYKKREPLSGVTDAYRVIFSEADALPGLIVDIYRDTAVFQVLTLGMEKFKPVIIDGLMSILKPKHLYEKSESPFRKIEGLKDIKIWHGAPGDTVIEIREGRAKFLVDIENGHKTGFYLDQRKSRLGLEGLAKGKNALDLFCYTGAFSVSAALYGAKSVRGVDIKGEWLSLAGKNAVLNGVSGNIEFIKEDAFKALKEIHASGEKFDLVIVDPPSFLKTRGSLVSASKGYKELNTLAMGALAEEGILATFSCSHSMPNETFSTILKESAAAAGKSFSILKRCHQAEDHPIVRAIPETEYLKGYFLKMQR
ncbi:MAG: class I SAM-dependent rRNA methyltransferase [Candidatus Omnitrophota bacterium]|nr:class I SAM-dependent rRNA methyltransferase [Candidatus Omnitrophota bacterium]